MTQSALVDEWYDVTDGPVLEQGDCFIEFPIYIQPGNTPFTREQARDKRRRPRADIEFFNVIVMTQSCDLERISDTDPVTLCPRFNCRDILTSQDAPKRLRAENGWAALKDGRLTDAHLLNACVIPSHEQDYQYVDLKRIYTVPYNFIKLFAEQHGPRLRLKSPYKEHLAQAFARRFMRVGLPSPIPSKYPY